VTTAAAIAVMLLAHFTTVGFGDLLSNSSYPKQGMLDNAMVIVLSALVAIWGVHTINALRKDVFEARQYGQYRLGRKLGSGGMGDVYLAEHRLLKRPSAIKLIRPDANADANADPGAIERFEVEVQATAAISHWNTVEIFDCLTMTPESRTSRIEDLPNRGPPQSRTSPIEDLPNRGPPQSRTSPISGPRVLSG
jgi:serine/threonine protein kinase